MVKQDSQQGREIILPVFFCCRSIRKELPAAELADAGRREAYLGNNDYGKENRKDHRGIDPAVLGRKGEKKNERDSDCIVFACLRYKVYFYHGGCLKPDSICQGRRKTVEKGKVFRSNTFRYNTGGISEGNGRFLETVEIPVYD